MAALVTVRADAYERPFTVHAEGWVLKGHNVSSLAVPPDSTLLLATSSRWDDPCPSTCGLYVFDVADPWHPRQLGFLADEKTEKLLVTRDGRQAFLLARGDQYEDTFVRVIDTSDPTSPRLFDSYAYRYAQDMAISADGSVLIAALPHTLDILTREPSGRYAPQRSLHFGELGLRAPFGRIALSEDGETLIVFEAESAGMYPIIDTGRTIVVDIRDPQQISIIEDPPSVFLNRYDDAAVPFDGRTILVGEHDVATVAIRGHEYSVVGRAAWTDSMPMGSLYPDIVFGFDGGRRAFVAVHSEFALIDARRPESQHLYQRGHLVVGWHTAIHAAAGAGPALYVGTSQGMALLNPERTMASWVHVNGQTDPIRFDPERTKYRRLPGEPWTKPSAWTWQEAVHNMGCDPINAEAAFRRAGSPVAKIYLALLIQVTRPPSDDRTAEVLKQLTDAALQGLYFDDTYLNRESLQIFYEGALNDLIHHLKLIMKAGRLPDFVVDCDLLIQHPQLWRLADFRYADSLPDAPPLTNCRMEDRPLPPSVRAYIKARAAPGVVGCVPSEVQMPLTNNDDLGELTKEALYRPIQRAAWGEWPTKHKAIPLQDWSLRGVHNRRQFMRLLPLYYEARDDLAEHLEDTFRLDPGLAMAGAEELLGHVEATRPPEPIREAILTGEPVAAIAALLGDKPVPRAPRETLSVLDPGVEYPDFYLDALAGLLEPILMTAVLRPDVMRLLIERGADIEERNEFGKTALMAAAQYDRIDSIDVLLAAGAQVNARSLHPSAIPNNAPCHRNSIRHGERTALMYAAANASLAVIERLLAAGADPTLKDSKRLTAYHYLVGDGPVAANPKLTPEDMETAKRLLSQ
jgi:hypothetical protein